MSTEFHPSHTRTNGSCEHVWRTDPVAKDVYVRVGDCEDFEDRFHYIGDRGWKVYKLDILNIELNKI